MKKILLFLVVVMLLTSLAACGGATPTTAPEEAATVEEEQAVATEEEPVAEPTQEPEVTEEPAAEETHDPVELQVMVFESPALTAEFWDQAIADTLATMPDYVSVEKIVSSLERDAYAKQLLATDQFPDVLMAVTISDFAQAGLLTPFDQAFIDETFIMPDAAIMDGKSWALPVGAQIIPLVYYNKAIFEEVGVEVPKTYDELVEVSQKLKDAGHTPILMCGAEPWCGSFPVVAMVSADVFGNNPDWVKQRKEGKVHFTDPEMVAAFQKFQDLVNAELIDPNGLGTDFATGNQAFYDGEAAMYLQGSWFIGYMTPEVSENTGLFLWPREDGKEVAPFYAGGGARVSALSENPEEAMEFAKTLELTYTKPLIKIDALFPMVKGMTIEDWGVDVSQLYLDGYNGIVTNDAIQKVSAFTWSNNDNDVIAGMKDEIYRSIQNIFLGADVMAEMERLDQAWDEAAAAMEK